MIKNHYLPSEQYIDGYIYLITNLVNNKKYVGQTVQTIDIRWRQHLSTALRQGSHSAMAIDRAIAKYGQENFTCEEIEHIQQTRRVLDQRERYWIHYYKTYVGEFGGDFGYNLTPGGQSNNSILSYEEEQQLLQIYLDTPTYTFQQLADIFGVSPTVVRSVLSKNDIPTRTSNEMAEIVRRTLGNSIRCYDGENQLIATFQSSHDAAKWLIQNCSDLEHYTDTSGIARSLRMAAYSHTLCYGYSWEIPDVSEEDGRQRYEAYCYKRHHTYDSQRDWEKRHSLRKRCPLCNEIISDESLACPRHRPLITIDECGNIVRKPHILNQHEVDPNELKQLLRFHTWQEIGSIYGVSDVAVKNLPRRILVLHESNRKLVISGTQI